MQTTHHIAKKLLAYETEVNAVNSPKFWSLDVRPSMDLEFNHWSDKILLLSNHTSSSLPLLLKSHFATFTEITRCTYAVGDLLLLLQVITSRRNFMKSSPFFKGAVETSLLSGCKRHSRVEVGTGERESREGCSKKNPE